MSEANKSGNDTAATREALTYPRPLEAETGMRDRLEYRP